MKIFHQIVGYNGKGKTVKIDKEIGQGKHPENRPPEAQDVFDMLVGGCNHFILPIFPFGEIVNNNKYNALNQYLQKVIKTMPNSFDELDNVLVHM